MNVISFGDSASVDGQAIAPASVTTGSGYFSNLVLTRDARLAWTNSNTAGSGDLTSLLVQDAPNTLALRNGANAQTLRVNATHTDDSNGRWISLETQAVKWKGSGTGQDGSTFYIGNSLSSGALVFLSSDTARWGIDENGHFLAQTNDTYDIGDGAGHDPRDGHFTGDLFVGAGGAFRWGGQANMYSSSSGVIALYNGANNGFTRLQFGGTGSEPALAVDGVNLAVVTANGGANSSLTAQNLRAYGYLASGTKTVGTIPDPGDVPVGSIYLVPDASGGERPFFNDGATWRDFAGTILS